MLAIFKTGGKQYSVKAGQILKVEKLEGKEGDNISFSKILVVTDNSDQTIGTPTIKNAKVEAKIVKQIRDKKIIVFKKRKRQNYRHTQGHRQHLTVLRIESIINGDKKSIALKKEVKKQKALTKDTSDTSKKNLEVSSKASKKSVAAKKTVVKKKTTIKKKIIKKVEEKK